MPIHAGDCHGGRNVREQLDAQYRITPISYIALAPNQTKPNCCSGTLTGNCYIFEYVHRNNPNDYGNFFVGTQCGVDFLDILSIPHSRYPLFNPLHQNNNGNNHNNNGNNHNNNGNNHNNNGNGQNQNGNNITGLNLEVYNAINMLCVAWDIIPANDLANILNYVRNPINQPTQNWAILRVNSIISHDYHHRTLQQIIQGFRNQYPNTRQFQFPQMNQIIQQAINQGQNITNYIN